MDNNKTRLFSSHSNFFSSLKQVEKRLKLDPTHPAKSETQESNFSSKESSSTLSSPIFLHLGTQICPTQDSSDPPLEFLSLPQQFPQTPQQNSPSDQPAMLNEAQDDDEIEQLMQLLGISEEQVEERDGFDFEDSCHCEGGFYSKIVGVKGPKCRKEVVRLDGWIKHFLNGNGEEEKLEPLRLAHLLLGKAAFVSQGDDGGFGGLEFPSTLREFLHTDPPSN